MPFIVPTLVLVIGLALLVSGVRRRPKGIVRIVVGACLLFAIGVPAVHAFYIEARLDLNPMVQDTRQLAGTWHHGATAFSLDSAGDWRCLTPRSVEPPCSRATTTGRWTARDFEVRFVAVNGDSTAALRIVTYRGAYRLIHPFEDPDDWDYSLDFERGPR